jgi:hypothetical protein
MMLRMMEIRRENQNAVFELKAEEKDFVGSRDV